VAVGIEEDARVAAPERLRPPARDRRARRIGLGDDRVHLLRGADVVRERDPAPAAGVLDAAVLGETGPVPERDDHAAGLEEDDVVVRLGSGRPAERFVERARALEIGHAQRDQADALLHARHSGSAPRSHG
jgi:hypothetical protein